MTINRLGLQLETHPGLRWFRIAGYGLSIVDHDVIRPTPAERFGFRRCWHLGRFGVRILTPWETL